MWSPVNRGLLENRLKKEAIVGKVPGLVKSILEMGTRTSRGALGKGLGFAAESFGKSMKKHPIDTGIGVAFGLPVAVEDVKKPFKFLSPKVGYGG